MLPAMTFLISSGGDADDLVLGLSPMTWRPLPEDDA